MIYENEIDDILIYNDKVDFRKSIDGLASLVEHHLGESPFAKTLFVFFSRNRSKVKILYWDHSGYALWYKRLERDRFILPKHLDLPKVVITRQQLRWLLSGLDIWKMKPHQQIIFQKAS